MKKISGDRVFVKFSKPDPITNIITVSRVLPDNTVEPIGKIYSELDRTGSVMYISANNQGEEIFPPTADFIEIEKHFERYANEISEKSKNESLEIKAEELINRERSIRTIRQWKFKNLEQNQIINNH